MTSIVICLYTKKKKNNTRITKMWSCSPEIHFKSKRYLTYLEHKNRLFKFRRIRKYLATRILFDKTLIIFYIMFYFEI